MKQFESSGVLDRLFLSFSRDGDGAGPRYVQDNIRALGREFVDLITDADTVLYVCGDARNMAKDVNEAVVGCVEKELGVSQKEARDVVADMVLNKRYLQDIWT